MYCLKKVIINLKTQMIWCWCFSSTYLNTHLVINTLFEIDVRNFYSSNLSPLVSPRETKESSPERSPMEISPAVQKAPETVSPRVKSLTADGSPATGNQTWGPPRTVELEREPNKSLGISIVGRFSLCTSYLIFLKRKCPIVIVVDIWHGIVVDFTGSVSTQLCTKYSWMNGMPISEQKWLKSIENKTGCLMIIFTRIIWEKPTLALNIQYIALIFFKP